MEAQEKHLIFLKRAIEISQQARENGNTPFGALLVDEEDNILLEQENIEITEHTCTGHAETTLAERASRLYDKDFLQTCRMYTTAEPCAMCSGAIYWSNIGTVVYGMTERKLLELTGSNEQNPTLDLPCRDVFTKGQKEITVIGPFPEIEADAAAVHEGYWD
ncbi:nucleoside deaminase [Enterococcus hulanensis]|uniref:Nucleoside deaminase n=1 Tax=Enterococcus hulanensis TaxID=2559929 RepID=A0ABU3EUX6_9ENTE|nr:nucleoside deaminase [Enterococcus hulanensis]MDT2598672.1 nucleoside deaminase [Enterococcus hulanensis]MDT2607823.1 nucleoside deaminase [Enterococcus hulanensis]MDT2615118.1 nucleoside deaminase [Enterococcus hulanensis]MDT2626911.1 nucleoside deaminase [Enterococcus hulanensis]MDT2654190.1 nucleoside deaminase [Enterococcus hulanensis]